ncbi:hypothetical protein [Mesorhizobium sp. B2-4-17]|uniref:hypothetical protein n=1 Tax=Mesorhizobium sp. B2-4-17 TaxID=2589932 RepID=UPI0015E2C90B|nr:hypothetical protein [Mesorhizobium sp. B2-4-17]
MTTADVDAEIRKQGLQIFKAIAREFPDDYDAMLRKITAAAQTGSGTEVRNVSRQAVADPRQRYTPLLTSAPDSEVSQALSAQLDMLNHVMARETPATCNNYLRNGPDAISAPGHDVLAHPDKIGATLFNAFGAAKKKRFAGGHAQRSGLVAGRRRLHQKRRHAGRDGRHRERRPGL